MNKLSFSTRLIAFFILISITFLSVTSLALIALTKRQAQSALEAKINAVTSIVQNFSGGPIWNMNYETLEAANNKIFEDADISGITYFDNNKKILLKKEREAIDQDISEIMREIVGGDDNSKIGYLKISYNTDRINKESNKITLMIAIAILALQAIFSLCLYIIVKKLSTPLQSEVQTLGVASQILDSDSKKLSHSSSKVAESIVSQSESIEHSSASLIEISAMLEKNLQSANSMKNDSSSIKNKCLDANEIMKQLQDSMQLISDSNDKVEELSSIIQNIKDKTAVMDEIVFQTKLLSFNASVEAERAGEHGRGFAVVAQEVGNLAGLSGSAAKEISHIVSESISQGDRISSENKVRVESGIELTKSAAEAFETILTSTQLLTEGCESIMTSSQEQSSAIKLISDSMLKLEEVTQDLKGESSSTKTISSTVLQQTVELQSSVESLNSVMNGEKKRAA